MSSRGRGKRPRERGILPAKTASAVGTSRDVSSTGTPSGTQKSNQRVVTADVHASADEIDVEPAVMLDEDAERPDVFSNDIATDDEIFFRPRSSEARPAV